MNYASSIIKILILYYIYFSNLLNIWACIQDILQVKVLLKYNILSMKIIHQSFLWFMIFWVFICSDDFILQSLCW